MKMKRVLIGMVGMLAIVLVAIMIPMGAMLTTVYHYGDTMLSRQEISERYESGRDLHCVETSNFLSIIATGYECFDTSEAAETFVAHRS